MTAATEGKLRRVETDRALINLNQTGVDGGCWACDGRNNVRCQLRETLSTALAAPKSLQPNKPKRHGLHRRHLQSSVSSSLSAAGAGGPIDAERKRPSSCTAAHHSFCSEKSQRSGSEADPPFCSHLPRPACPMRFDFGSPGLHLVSSRSSMGMGVDVEKVLAASLTRLSRRRAPNTPVTANDNDISGSAPSICAYSGCCIAHYLIKACQQ